MTNDTPTKNLYGLGRRKSAIAQAILTNNALERTINKIKFEEYFTTIGMRQVALGALVTTSQNDLYGFKIKVHGGGKQAQAGAVRLALARALVGADEGFRKQLKDGQFLSRDARVKERKKPGLKRARRAPQFSKR